MILTVGNTKGGVGKTTLAVNLAVARALQGKEILLIDGDRQGNSQMALSIRAEGGRQPGVACAAAVEGPALRSLVQQMKGKFDDIIIDVGGRDSAALRAALVLTDVLLVPFQPRSFDVWALGDISSLVEEARGVRDGLVALAVLNNADPGLFSSDNREAAAAVKEISGLEYVDAPMKRRKAYTTAAALGECVFEVKPRDDKAERELQILMDKVFNIM